MLKVPKSPELKLARGYSDPKSIVWADGREVLKGKDWKMRVNELFLRCGGQCEQFMPKGEDGQRIIEQAKLTTVIAHPSYFKRCLKEADDPHHIIPRSKGRDDRLDNLVALCREHHMLVDPRMVKWSKP